MTQIIPIKLGLSIVLDHDPEKSLKTILHFQVSHPIDSVGSKLHRAQPWPSSAPGGQPGRPMDRGNHLGVSLQKV